MTSSPPWTDVPRPPRGTRVVLGLSGGVDSAVAAHRLLEWGCEVTAVTTRNFCFDEAPFDVAATTSSCCGLEAMEAAASVAAECGIAHRVLDVSDRFGPLVVDDYREEYRGGRTPSPCVRCNTMVRFPELARFARSIGASHVATGHYARQVEVGGERYVRRGVDSNKDQSYFLYRLPSSSLQRTLFPLGDLRKDEVREIARQAGLPVAETPESQELCFVPDGDRRPLLSSTAREGEIVDASGKVLGRHDGIEFFTVGQRRGLGLGGGQPYFVLRLEPASNRVVVGDAAELDRDRLYCGDVELRGPAWLDRELHAQTRYRHSGTACEDVRWDVSDRRMVVDLREADRAPAPGQSVVLYADEVVVGGGVLERAELRGEHHGGLGRARASGHGEGGDAGHEKGAA